MPKFRYFTNRIEDYSAHADVSVDKERWLSRIKSLIAEILEYIRGEKSTDGGLYVGSIGVAYMLCYASEFEPLHDRKMVYLNEASDVYKFNRNYFDRHRPRDSDRTSFVLGEAGLNTVGLYFGSLTKNKSLVSTNLDQYLSLHKTFLHLNMRCGSDELFVGRAGYLCGIYFIKNILGNQEKLDTMFELNQGIDDIILAMIRSGRSLAAKIRSPTPLMYSYYDTLYLGAAHGLSSILQMALQHKTFIERHPMEAAWVKDSVDWLLTIQQPNGNFAPAMDELSSPRSEKDELIHWCHGAPGVIYLLARAYVVWKEEKYLNACLKCGECVWQKGLLTKGPGICHGIAGNGYVFLLLYRLTQDKKHLYRAMQFANFMLTDEFQSKARTPDNPYSLYEGMAGTVCFMIDLLQPEKATFPFFNVFDDD
ncbi:lanC-like protein 3 [Biomphalaria pfeifferi]|uniref:LanC-like protein 3 n=1 Tax=Biomphalaria pfeifferi TaxID=112525 RepID=A0AAD8EWZ8_BIOPF|nr:lanC-like protein 3 [Biomphalaria pfeifferi]